VTYYTVFVIELQSRRVHVAGSTPFPDEAFVLKAYAAWRMRLTVSWLVVAF